MLLGRRSRILERKRPGRPVWTVGCSASEGCRLELVVLEELSAEAVEDTGEVQG